jgi:hypothetical protein
LDRVKQLERFRRFLAHFGAPFGDRIIGDSGQGQRQQQGQAKQADQFSHDEPQWKFEY